MNLLLGGIMVFRRNKNGILEIQVKPRGKYRTLYHRMVKGKYQVYYKGTNDKDVILTLEEKVKFFETMNNAWKNKADPSKFMSAKETEQLEKVVVKK